MPEEGLDLPAQRLGRELVAGAGLLQGAQFHGRLLRGGEFRGQVLGRSGLGRRFGLDGGLQFRGAVLERLDRAVEFMPQIGDLPLAGEQGLLRLEDRASQEEQIQQPLDEQAAQERGDRRQPRGVNEGEHRTKRGDWLPRLTGASTQGNPESRRKRAVSGALGGDDKILP